MANKTLFGAEARSAMMGGIETVYKAVSATLGASGRNGAYHQWGRPKITNDGVTIARQIDPQDPYEKMGAEFIKEAAEKTNSQAGDATTTSTILAYEMIKKGLVAIENGANPMQLRREIEQTIPVILQKLKESAIPVDSDEVLIEVAVVSSESREIGEIIARAVKDVGKDGLVSVEESNGLSITTEKVDGLQFDQGFMSPYMVTNPQKMEAVIENCPILITDRQYNLEKDFIPLFEELIKGGVNKILIIAEDVSGILLQSLIKNKLMGVFTAVVVKKPYYAETLEDIAILTGGTAITKDKGVITLNPSYLGRADKIVVTTDSTTIIGGSGDKEKLAARVEELRSQIADQEHDFEKDKLRERLAKLVGGVTVIKVGASTEAEMKYLKLKIDDAVSATRAAVEEGIVAGGGAALFHIAHNLPADTDGALVVLSACKEPLYKIIQNSGKELSLANNLVVGGGYNALTQQVEEDMIKAGIIDPAKVERCALTNAASLAAIFLTIESATADLPEEKVTV